MRMKGWQHDPPLPLGHRSASKVRAAGGAHLGTGECRDSKGCITRKNGSDVHWPLLAHHAGVTRARIYNSLSNITTLTTCSPGVSELRGVPRRVPWPRC